MTINIRTKGQNGEREIAKDLNAIIRVVMNERNMKDISEEVIQRNQNQSAVGGSDLTNVFDLSIEIKRQETLNVNTWWKQCIASAERNNHIPILIFRQNRKSWRVVMNTLMNVGNKQIQVRSEIDYEDFKYWFYLYTQFQFENGYELKV